MTRTACSWTLLVAFGVSAATLGAVPVGAAQPPRVGSVACGLSGNARFSPVLRFVPGVKPNGQPKPDTDARVKLATAPAGCSGTQTGGNPHKPGPIDHAKFRSSGHATGHTCSGLSANGVQSLKTRIIWYDAAGTNLGVTKIAVASATVANLGSGNPPGFGPPTYPPPGIITITFTGTGDPASSTFPGEMVQATFVADRTVDSFPLPCSSFGPPLEPGVAEFTFTGAQGPSSISVS